MSTGPTSPRNRRVAIASLAIVALLVLTSLVTAVLLSGTNRALSDAYEGRYRAYLLADQLRQSSDDLTRMVRTYAATGETRFAQYFQTVLDIRNGVAPRPEMYNAIYWDYVTATDSYPRQSGPPVTIDNLMADAGFTDAEVALFSESENESNDLVLLENAAMSLLDGLDLPPEGNVTDEIAGKQRQAIAMLHGRQYHEAKARIMDPLERLFESLESRTQAEIERLRNRERLLVYALEGQLGVAAIALAIVLYLALRRRSADESPAVSSGQETEEST